MGFYEIRQATSIDRNALRFSAAESLATDTLSLSWLTGLLIRDGVRAGQPPINRWPDRYFVPGEAIGYCMAWTLSPMVSFGPMMVRRLWRQNHLAVITASQLYDLVNCPHRVSMDAFADPNGRDEINPFIRLLWERGSAWEEEVVSGLGVPFIDLSPFSLDENERLTAEAMERREPLILGCRISADDLLGDPDLLRLEGDGYVPIDIKSGRGEEGGSDESDPKPKKHYTVQLGLYLDILERKKMAGGRHGYIWDGHGDEVRYDFDQPYGVRTQHTPWQDYKEALNQARAILSSPEASSPAYSSGNCKLCWWYTACLKTLEDADDLTLIPELGRRARDGLIDTFPTIEDLADINPEGFIRKETTEFAGVGAKSLRKFHERASLIKTPNAQPRLKDVVKLPSKPLELFFDIEVDPMQDVCYLHGFVERRDGNNATERFVAFFADEPTPADEERVFREAWAYFSANPDAAIFYYSKYERTIYRKLQQKYPGVCTAEDIKALFDPNRAVDLYFDVVQKATIWPTRDHSIKTLASFLGFQWRDPNPSGAASIEWYARWCKTRDPATKQQILEYNEDDCRATRVLLDGIWAM